MTSFTSHKLKTRGSLRKEKRQLLCEEKLPLCNFTREDSALRALKNLIYS